MLPFILSGFNTPDLYLNNDANKSETRNLSQRKSHTTSVLVARVFSKLRSNYFGNRQEKLSFQALKGNRPTKDRSEKNLVRY